MRDLIEAGSVRAFWWLDTRDMLPDALTKGTIPREALLAVWRTGIWTLIGDRPARFAGRAVTRLSGQSGPGSKAPGVRLSSRHQGV